MSLKAAAQHLRTQGRGKDTELVHLTKREVRAMEGLAAAAGGKLTRNPKTGLPEAGFLDSMLPTILGFGANFLLPGSGMIVGGLTGALQNKENPLMGAALGAVGGYGGGQLASGIGGLASAAPEVAGAAIQNPALTSVVGTGAGSQASMLAAQNAGFGMEGATQLAQAAGGAAPTTTGFIGSGLQAAAQNPMNYVKEMGGMMPTAKAAGYAAAPALYDSMMGGAPKETEKPDWASAEGRSFEYDPGYTGGTMTGTDVSSERQWFTPSYREMAAGGQVSGYFKGGLAERAPSQAPAAAPAGPPKQAVTSTGAPAFDFDQAKGTFSARMEAPGATRNSNDPVGAFSKGSFKDRYMRMVAASAASKMGESAPRFEGYAEGGSVDMESGGFVIPADVVSMAGGGSTDAGLAALAKRTGARPIKGRGTGLSDDIPARIDGRPIAKVANGEAYIPRDTVKKLGGAKRLYKTMDNIRQQAHGKRQQQRPVDLKKAMA